MNTTMNGEGSYYYDTSYSIPGRYTFYIWAEDTSGNSAKSSIRTFSVVRWNVDLNISESGSSYYDISTFGEVDDASDGQDSYDIPKPPTPSNPYVNSWFDAGLSSPYDRLWADYRDYPDKNETWNLFIKCNTAPPVAGDTDILISWDTDAEMAVAILSRITRFDLILFVW